jgi:hypothetical protein
VGRHAVRVVLHLGALSAARLDYSAMQVGLAFLPASILMAGLSLGLSAKLVMRFGLRAPLSLGLLVASAGLIWLDPVKRASRSLRVPDCRIVRECRMGNATEPGA